MADEPVRPEGSESRTGYSVHLSVDVMGVDSREEARDAFMALMGELPGNMKVTAVHVGKYVVASLADKYKGLL